MFRILLFSLLLFSSVLTLPAVETQTALGALRTLPPEESQRVARIDGCDGTPMPERWHFLVYDPQTENGYREYVVADRQLVARREVSQFGDQFQSTDIIGKAFRIDSDRVAQIAQRYVAANDLAVVSMNYEMRRGLRTGPVWEVTCFDRDNQAIGWLVVNAEDESVLSHTGFAKVPIAEQESFSIERPSPKPRKVKSQGTPITPTSPIVTEVQEQTAHPVEARPVETTRPVEVRRAERAEPRPPTRKPFRLFDRPLFGPDND